MSLDRRGLLLGAGGLLLGGCDRLSQSKPFQGFLDAGEGLTSRVQRLIIPRDALAPEFSAAEMSPVFRTNGNSMPASPAYAQLLAGNFANWSLVVDGLVTRPLALSLEQIRGLPARTQITRHDCVEGWSAIGQWTGVPLALLLKAAGLRSEARYIVFHCADDFGGTPYYESIDLIDAFHPQTILAWGMNGRPLEVGHGAPLRLRVERQLGYKQAKYVMRVEAVDRLSRIGRGKGGYWEDVAGYQWYAGI
ncbi:molybdopterin-binding protein [Sphingomonas ginkgonis]|uniref:Molybdopterin-binding protein n=1 Tax=Sphingomonas ginkgonis TaxID=2315330 RepID=A0A429V9E6_9SPHN|nr:molybdopterin-dependent oxidoreductase [Sphingomonas ginkgonis]RST30613.1 molybdopterin-binding protein [Sphingomonas ginkgonis]